MDREENKYSLLKKLWIGIGILAVLTPLGMLAEGTAWGEWGVSEIKSLVGFVPHGFERLAEIFHVFLPDYSIPGFEGGIKSYAGYFFSGLIGIVAVTLLAIAFGRLLSSKGNSQIDDEKRTK